MILKKQTTFLFALFLLLSTSGYTQEFSKSSLKNWYDSPITSSEYFFKLYYGGTLGAGLRIDPPKSKIAYEIAPLNVYFGNDYFMLGFFRFGIDLKINQKKTKKI